MTQTARKTEKPQKMVTTKQYEAGVMAEFLGLDDGSLVEFLKPGFITLIGIGIFVLRIKRSRDYWKKQQRKQRRKQREKQKKPPHFS